MVHLTFRVFTKVRNKFVDNVRIFVKGGTGGAGQPKYGGVGGSGGNVLAVGDEKATLKAIIQKYPTKRFIAGAGENSTLRMLQGQPGDDVVIKVPPGVSINTDSGRVLGEINEDGDEVIIVKGGAGGGPKNNFHVSKGMSTSVRLDLKLLADIGLVGFPNAGKSTFLSAVSRAMPKIAAYPFTTISPQLGIMESEDHRQISMADLPGLIEGAHINVGMGHRFLKHVERTKLLLFMVDIHGFKLGAKHPHRTAFQTILLLMRELEMYKEELFLKPAVLALNKMDIQGSEELAEELRYKIDNMEDYLHEVEEQYRPKKLVQFDDCFTISAKKKTSTEELKQRLRELLDYYAEDTQQDNCDMKLQNYLRQNRNEHHRSGHFV